MEAIASSVGDALELRKREYEADRERFKQSKIEDEIARTVGSGDDKKDKFAAEDSAPERQQSLDIPNEKNANQSPQPDQGAKEKQEIDAEAVIDKFNIIRSGRSMNDNDISSALQKMLNGLDANTRATLFKVLQNVATVVAPAVDASRMTKPPEEPSAVQNARLQMLQKRRQDRENAADSRVANASKEIAVNDAPERKAELEPELEPSQDDQTQQDEIEDTSPPIRVGKRTAEGIQRRVKLLMHS